MKKEINSDNSENSPINGEQLSKLISTDNWTEIKKLILSEKVRLMPAEKLDQLIGALNNAQTIKKEHKIIVESLFLLAGAIQHIPDHADQMLVYYDPATEKIDTGKIMGEALTQYMGDSPVTNMAISALNSFGVKVKKGDPHNNVFSIWQDIGDNIDTRNLDQIKLKELKEIFDRNGINLISWIILFQKLGALKNQPKKLSNGRNRG